MTRHEILDPDGLPPAKGFSYGVLPARGRLLYIAGLTGHHEDESIAEDLIGQFGEACRSVARVIVEAGGSPSDLVSMTIYTTAIAEYRRDLRDIGVAYREVFGRHYPPMALIGVAELFDPRVVVELICVAVVPDEV